MSRIDLEGLTRKAEHAMAVSLLLAVAEVDSKNANTIGELLSDLLADVLQGLQVAEGGAA